MKKINDFLRRVGLLKSGSGDYYAGEFNNRRNSSESAKNEKGNDLSGAPAKVGTVKSSRAALAGTTPVWLWVLLALLAGLFLLMALGIGWGSFFLMLVIWVVFTIALWKFSFTLLLQIIFLAVISIFSLGYLISVYDGSSSDTENNTEPTSSVIKQDNEIYVEGESGSLSGGGKYSYTGKSARGAEAYLGEGGAIVNYEISSPDGGAYELFVRLFDDGVHPDGSRNATVAVNGINIAYSHTSEDTKGWKWYSLGEVNLKAGENIVSVAKDKTTGAAFVMDAFKLVPKK